MTTRPGRFVVVLVLVSAVGLFGVACGGDGGAGTDTGTVLGRDGPGADATSVSAPDAGSHPDMGRGPAPDASRADGGGVALPDGSPADALASSDALGSGADLAAIRVSGNQLVDPAGQPLRLRGVNRSGSEYACIQNNGFFDGPTDDASIDAITAWHANVVRVPLNEDCWLAINGAPAAYSGAAYQTAIADYVGRLVSHGLFVILELHWSGADGTSATQQQPMPNRGHSVLFWTQVAGAFKDNGNVLFELFNEPFPDNNQDTDEAWRCWRDGGQCQGFSYVAAGMQELVAAVRGAEAKNPILLGGVEYSNALSQWLAHKPDDPLNSLVAAWHIYNFNGCKDASCFDANAGPVTAQVPIVATEIGEDDCSGDFITSVMQWLDGHSGSYLGWTWDNWGGCLVLITDYTGTPNGAYGQTFKDHLAAP